MTSAFSILESPGLMMTAQIWEYMLELTCCAWVLLLCKGRTIRKVMGGGWGKYKKKIRASQNARKKNSCKPRRKKKKFLQKEIKELL